MKAFDELTNRGRAMRLRRMALSALERYDLDVKRVRLITNDLNGIFRLDTFSGQKYVLRVCLPQGGHSLEEVRSEMMWLAALRRDTELGVPEPLTTRSGELVTTVQVEGVPEPRHCVIFGWLPGPDLVDRLTLENVRKMGELAARLHAHAAAFQPPEGFQVKISDSVCPFGDPVVLFDDAYRELVPPGRRELFQAAWDKVESTLERLYRDREGVRVVHHDLHQWNVKVYRGKLYALDFEDLMWGFPVQDVAVTFYYWQDREDFAALREAFRQGYTRHSEWPEQVAGEIDTLIAGRGLDLANFVLQDPNPDWQQQAPSFVERTERRLVSILGRI
jgi:Ser/Thr protein kinase RdoA (MazF antagonist)